MHAFNKPLRTLLTIAATLAMATAFLFSCPPMRTADAAPPGLFSYTADTATVATSLGVLKWEYAELGLANPADIGLESNHGMQRYKAADKHLQVFIKSFCEKVTEASGVNSIRWNANQLRILHARGQAAYTEARALLKERWVNIPSEARDQLHAYDAITRDIAAALKRQLAKPNDTDITKTVRGILALGNMATWALGELG